MALYIGSQKVIPSGIGKIYVGSTLIYGSAPTPVGPSKGDIISFDAFGDSTQKRFRVLAINGNSAKLLALDNYASGNYNSSLVSINYDGGELGVDYNGSALDTRLNTTYYNALSSTVKNAISQTTVVQSLWKYMNWDASSTSASYLNQQKANGKYYQAERVDQQTIGSRYIHALDVDELCEYFNVATAGGTINYADVNTLFEVTSSTESNLLPWFCSSRWIDQQPQAYYWHSSNGWVESAAVTYSHGSYPVFTIDLSQIEYTIEN